MSNIVDRQDIENTSFRVNFELRNVKRLTKMYGKRKSYKYMGELWTTNNPENKPMLLVKKFSFNAKNVKDLKLHVYIFNIRNKTKTYNKR